MEITVAELREGDEVVVAEGTAIVRVAVRRLRSGSLLKLPGDLMITNNHPVRIQGQWQMPGKMDIAELVELDEPIYIYNFVLDSCHVLMVNGYEAVTLGHNLDDPVIYHPYYSTDKITIDLLKLPGVEGLRTVPGTDEGGKGDYATQGTTAVITEFV
jgi:hypothetical protein